MDYQSTNLEKYQVKNPIVRKLLNLFLDRIENYCKNFNSVLEAGCGEGFVLNRLNIPFKVGVDISYDAVSWGKNNFEDINFLQGDIYNLPFSDDSFELVMALEVLEHLEEPEKALRELKRIASKQVVISVPFEPYFRAGNFLRGKYLSSMGNHPEHIQQFNKRKLDKLLALEFVNYNIVVSFPWLIAICEI